MDKTKIQGKVYKNENWVKGFLEKFMSYAGNSSGSWKKGVKDLVMTKIAITKIPFKTETQ